MGYGATMLPNLFLSTLLMLTVTAQVLRQGSCPKVTPVKNLNIHKYMGLWYEQVHTRRWTGLELKCNIEYLIEDSTNGYHLHSYMYSIAANRTFHVHGVATFISKMQGSMMIKIDTLDKKGEVSILDTDLTSYTVMYSCLNVQNLHFGITVAENFVIMTRKQHPENFVINKAFNVLAKNKINATKLRFTSHNDCPHIDAAALSKAHCNKACQLSAASSHATNKEKQPFEDENNNDHKTEKPEEYENKEVKMEVHEVHTKKEEVHTERNAFINKISKKSSVTNHREKLHTTENIVKSEEQQVTETSVHISTQTEHEETASHLDEKITDKYEKTPTITETENSAIIGKTTEHISVSSTPASQLKENLQTSEIKPNEHSKDNTDTPENKSTTEKLNVKMSEKEGKHLLLRSSQKSEEHIVLSSTSEPEITSINSNDDEEFIVPKNKMIVTSNEHIMPPSTFIPRNKINFDKSVSHKKNDNTQEVKATQKDTVEHKSDDSLKNSTVNAPTTDKLDINNSQLNTKMEDKSLQSSTLVTTEQTKVTDESTITTTLSSTTKSPEQQKNPKENTNISKPLPEVDVNTRNNSDTNFDDDKKENLSTDVNLTQTSIKSDVFLTTSSTANNKPSDVENNKNTESITTETANIKVADELLTTVTVTTNEPEDDNSSKLGISEMTTMNQPQISTPASSSNLPGSKVNKPKEVALDIHKKA